MLSFAMAVAGSYDGDSFEPRNPARQTFYRELRPISEAFQQDALDVNQLDRLKLMREGQGPQEAMSDAAAWVQEVSEGHRPVLVAYPVAFDWAFLYWYFIYFTGDSPFGYSSCLDIRTLYQAKAKTVHDRSSKKDMPSYLRPEALHTHNALDDAVEQAELFSNVFRWVVESQPSGRVGVVRALSE
jgi:hypothetical protein